MLIGAYNACLGDKPLGEALDMIASLGLTSAEINSGGFLPPIHLPVDDLRASEDARQEYLGEFSSRGLTLTALNCNGNPLHPAAGFPHSQDLIDSIELAALLGVKRVITMSGAPGGEPGTSVPVWNPLPWWSPFLDVQDHQWSVAVPYWKDVEARAADADVKVAIEMHPGNIVFNPRTLHRLVAETNATHIGAEMDPSHLFWQGIDPVLAVADLGELVYIAAAKDTRINDAAKVNGVIDDSFYRVAEGEPGYLPLGGGSTLSGWPKNPSWDFVAVGRGHDTAYWTEFLRALHKVDPDMPVNIEHEDQELDQMEGLRFAAATLLEAEKAL
ncbi:sugar phosphate isomerase/epimerase family protein [Humibacillus xanthopallidus]|uniref:Sugar phosphate isomerase/epimerase n=1 Tax=Humibacillus xanthopallidus TaxID=412689 RepID=A0A543I2R3_9MICO|nr:sugar phosphate isomerase/epimerase [Humibacillus xanthopallidus]TQM64831.1 sugar phosphate isomerase/epimerase [Humibacillus xanthopallidus]